MQLKRQKALSLLEAISKRAQLMEGEEGVRRILREVSRNERITTKELASAVCLPLPVTSATRRELEKEGLLARDGGIRLTEKGKNIAKRQLGLTCQQRLTCPKCQGRTIAISKEFTPILTKLKKHLKSRPEVLPWLDQAHGTPETALRRAIYMLEKGDVEGRRIIFLGDDDFTSVAVGMLRGAEEVTVVDVDSRLIETIQKISKKENLKINCIHHDLRSPLPHKLHNQFDTAFTDPPYTISGLNLFVSRSITALTSRRTAYVYLAFSHQPPRKMLKLQRSLGAMGLAISEQIPRFNKYEGAEMFANTTQLMRLETTEESKPLVRGEFNGKLYTGEINQTIRLYKCKCLKQIDVGSGASFRSIEELKAKGCPKCGNTSGFKLKKKVKLKEALSKRIKLRDFQWEDFSAILEFEREISRTSFPRTPITDREYHKLKLEKAVRMSKAKQTCLKVAVLDDQIVGWLWLRTEKDRNTNEKFGYIKSIIVDREHRRQGFGKRLVEAAESHLRSRGIPRIDLIVSAANYDANLFFENVGFKRQHSTMRKKL